MSNRRVKSLAAEDDYEEDDYDEEYDDGEDYLSPDDKEQMRVGTIKVREVLGSTSHPTDSEIQEALWHYYYDVAKSVTYLKNKITPIPPNKKKPVIGVKNKGVLKQSLKMNAAVDFFKDCPWLQVPEYRRAEITIEPLYPRPRLLGGASKDGKTSKLAVLAAKRRQKEQEKSQISSGGGGAASLDDYASNLSKLKLGQSNAVRVGENKNLDSESHLSKKNAGPRLKKSKDLEVHESKGEVNRVEPEHVELSTADYRALPSAFASILTYPTVEENSAKTFKPLNENIPAKIFDFTEPSPDDVVSKTQKSKAATTPKTTSTENTKTKPDLNDGIDALSIRDTHITKSKNLDVLAEYKKTKRKNAANFVVIGHVDAGKSTLMGRLLFELKAVDQRTLDRYKRESEKIGKGSFALAWVMDQGTEERARGVTIDIATNKFETDKTSFTILDAPGHRDFVPNMIAGASQADFAVLVIDASAGNFESGLKGQTKEHALLVRSIGVTRMIVAVNKMDMTGWSQDRFQEIQLQMSGFLTTAGFQSKNVAYIPCSGLEGENILVKPKAKTSSWYTGPTLVEELELSEPSTYALDKPLRMMINNIFRGGVQNPLSISGRIEAGTIQTGEQIVIMPSTEQVSIKSLEIDEEPSEWAVAGQNVTLNLSNVDPIHLKVGDVICSPGATMIKTVSECRAKILAFEHLTPMHVDVHRGCLHIPGRISQLVAVLDKSTGAVVKKKPKIAQPGNVVRVTLRLEQLVPLEAPARIVLRANGVTVAAGMLE